MRFTWDEAKRQSNLRKHGFDFANAEVVFKSDVIILEDDRFPYGEDHFIALGWLGDALIAVAFVEEDQDTIRVISMRKASNYEHTTYERGFFD